MKCPVCNHQTRVIDSREGAENDAVRRRRQCTRKRCAHRFTTYEMSLSRFKEETDWRAKAAERLAKEINRFKRAIL